MSRLIKFRAWIIPQKRMAGWDGHDGVIQYFKAMAQDPDVVLMQFTGLLDKNGKEIWEGDIIGFGDGGTGQVMSGLDLKGGYNDPDYHGFLIRYGQANYLFEWAKIGKLEVLGNIYEHADLLK